MVQLKTRANSSQLYRRIDQAESKFREVVDEYRAGDMRLELLASHAYAH